jgi:hypothetical protein
LVNQEARAVMGCFRTTNLGALAMKSGLRPARPNWRTGNDGSGYGYSVHHTATRPRKWWGSIGNWEEVGAGTWVLRQDGGHSLVGGAGGI